VIGEVLRVERVKRRKRARIGIEIGSVVVREGIEREVKKEEMSQTMRVT